MNEIKSYIKDLDLLVDDDSYSSKTTLNTKFPMGKTGLGDMEVTEGNITLKSLVEIVCTAEAASNFILPFLAPAGTGNTN